MEKVTKPADAPVEKPAANVAKRKTSPEKEMARARALRSETIDAYDIEQPSRSKKYPKTIDGCAEER